MFNSLGLLYQPTVLGSVFRQCASWRRLPCDPHAAKRSCPDSAHQPTSVSDGRCLSIEEVSRTKKRAPLNLTSSVTLAKLRCQHVCPLQEGTKAAATAYDAVSGIVRSLPTEVFSTFPCKPYPPVGAQLDRWRAVRGCDAAHKHVWLVMYVSHGVVSASPARASVSGRLVLSLSTGRTDAQRHSPMDGNSTSTLEGFVAVLLEWSGFLLDLHILIRLVVSLPPLGCCTVPGKLSAEERRRCVVGKCLLAAFRILLRDRCWRSRNIDIINTKRSYRDVLGGDFAAPCSSQPRTMLRTDEQGLTSDCKAADITTATMLPECSSMQQPCAKRPTWRLHADHVFPPTSLLL